MFRLKAILLRSGDHTGPRSSRPSGVSLVSPVPSGFTTYIAAVPPSHELKAIFDDEGTVVAVVIVSAVGRGRDRVLAVTGEENE